MPDKMRECLQCSIPVVQPARGWKLYCDECGRSRDLASKRNCSRRWHGEHRDEGIARRREYYHSRETTPEKKALRSAKAKVERASLKAKVLENYGNCCACCGETAPEFLSVDHINGDGKQHRALTGTGLNFYRSIIKNNYPDDLRVLCFNCNMARGFFGYCPHERQ